MVLNGKEAGGYVRSIGWPIVGADAICKLLNEFKESLAV